MIHILVTDQTVKNINSDTHDSYEGLKVELKGSGVVVFLTDELVRKLAGFKEESGYFTPQVHAKRKLRDLIKIDENCSGTFTGGEKSFLIGLKRTILKCDADLSTSQKSQINALWERYQPLIEKVEQDNIPF